MKKILLIILLLFTFSGCTKSSVVTLNKDNWPLSVPYCNYGENKTIEDNKIIKLETITKEEKDNYFKEVKSKYPSPIYETENEYQVMGSEQKVIEFVYNNEEKTLTINLG